MEESTSKGEDAGNDHKSPPKKARIDEQQPSTSSATTSAAASAEVPSNGESVSNGENANGEERPSPVQPPRSTRGTRPGLSLFEMLEATSDSPRWQQLIEGRFGVNEDDMPPREEQPPRAEAANETNALAVANPPAASSSSNRPPSRGRQELDRLRRNVRRLAYASIFNRDVNEAHEQDDDDSSDDDDYDLNDPEVAGRMREELTNDIAELFAPPQFFDEQAESSDNSSDDVPGGLVPHLVENIDVGAMDYASEESFSDSSSDSSMSSSSEESFPGSTESETAVEDNPDPAELVDMKNITCMMFDDLKDNWNMMRDIQQRQYGLPLRATASSHGGRYTPGQFQKRAYSSMHVMKRLGLLHRLEAHTGCVNSLSFNSSGKLLVSGSDDLHVNLWQWESRKLLKSINSGHRLNVFQTKFMEYKGYEGELEIISTGRDGQVRHTRVDPSGRSNTELLFRGHSPIHKIAIPARNEFSFMTAGEDGKVRIYDLRQGKQEMLKKLHRPLYSIATHPYDSEFCIAGGDSYVRVYDMRSVTKPLRLLVSQRYTTQEDTRGTESITCAVYNENGKEILASFSDDDIYLYDNTSTQSVVKPTNRYQGHRNSQTIKGVNFFGPHSEYVVSGSDCGYVYIWEKSSQVIVNWMHGDRRGAVNCLEPHPEFPILATSGVDKDIKIWVPKGPKEDQKVPMFQTHDLRRIVRRNMFERRNTFMHPRLLRLATPSLSAYLASSNNFRQRLAQVRTNRRNRANNGNNDMDDEPEDSPHQMLRCNPS
ncbi:DDB1- and CUL4-associated factor 8-like [Anopheles coustani]|uniref:DDB1- and CUL4-associated factor 8-like n=2 Tax=coustani group TaxID=59130 RepID=UPI002658FAC4|nr:DDB1- and CUL4-associated factor 8-like [Anopheles coustani]